MGLVTSVAMPVFNRSTDIVSEINNNRLGVDMMVVDYYVRPHDPLSRKQKVEYLNDMIAASK